MIINADSLLPHLKEKVRLSQSDASRHLLCPSCGVRTRLNTLADGRRKCTVCGKKFRIHKVTDQNKLQQCAEILLCFCLDLSAHRTSIITYHRYRLVTHYYNHFRLLIAEKSLPKEIRQILTEHKGDIHMLHEKSRCKWCKSKIRSGAAKENPPVFGVQFHESGEVSIDPLKDDEAMPLFHGFDSKEETVNNRVGYAGVFCCGKFHQFTKDKQMKHDADQLCTWIQERARSHRGIWNKNTAFYVKELEWKYNNRSLEPEQQAQIIIELMPMNFLSSWPLHKTKVDVVQMST